MAYFKEAQLWFGFDLLFIMGKSMEIAENINHNYPDECTSLALSAGLGQQPESVTIWQAKSTLQKHWSCFLSVSPDLSMLLPTRTAELVP